MGIFMWFGSVLGWLLWFLYVIVQNYGVAILLFTLILKLLMFPFSVKQQKSMAAQSKMAKKQQELQKKYANNKQLLQEETAKLYEKEGVNPMGGCLPMLIPFPIMFGIYYSVLYPLQNALHISSGTVTKATQLLQQIPGISSTFNQQYSEIEIIRNFGHLRDYMTMFTGDEVNRIDMFSHGFKFFGLDLLGSPNQSGFSSFLWLIPVLCLVSSYVGQFITMRMQPGMQQQQGCMKWMMYLLPLMTVYLSFIMPAAVGFYWVIQTIIGFLQTIVLNKFYSPAIMNAKMEAQRIALRAEEELRIHELPLTAQEEMVKKLTAQQQKPQQKPQGGQKTKKNTSKKSSTEYRGSKK